MRFMYRPRYWTVLAFILILLQSNPSSSEMSNSNGYPVQIDAQEILDKMERGEDINYGLNSTIIGDLDSSRLIHKYITSNIKLHSKIQGKLDLVHLIFAKDVDFSSSIFNDRANFNHCVFQKNCNFLSSRFYGATDYSSSIFNGESLFNEVVFANGVRFDHAQFLGGAYFEGSEYDHAASFYNSSFIGTSNFIDTKFAQGSDFSLAYFGENGQFQDSSFEKRVLFRATIFQKEAHFLNSKFQNDADLRGAAFGDLAEFGSAIFDKMAYFNGNPSEKLTGATFKGDLRLNGSKIQNIMLQDAVFSDNSRIFLQNSEFIHLLIKWDDLKNHLPFDGSVYLALIKNFKDLEQFSDADECYYQYRYRSMKGPLDYASWISIGFGVRPYYTILISIVLIILFGMIFWLGGDVHRTNPSHKAVFSKYYRKKRRIHLRDLFHALFFSLLVFTFQARGEWSVTGTYRIVAALEGIIGLVLIGLFSVTLANIMIRY
jgi:hypothetical protein